MFLNRLKILENKTYILFFIFFISIIIKIIFKVDYLEDYDAIDFVYGLKDYDLSEYKPHFPGYPVYIFIGRILFAVIKDAPLSLITLNILFGSFCAVFVYKIADELFDSKTALLAAALFIANPAVSILSNSVNSDICGLLFLLMFLYFVILSEKYVDKRVRYIFFASALLGITLGVRASYAPFLVLWLASCRFYSLFRLEDYKELHLDDNTFLSAGFGLLIGVVLWLVPLLYVVGATDYYYEGLKFVTGHFNEWGGTYITDPSLLTRLHTLIWQLFSKGLGLYYYDTSIVRLVPTFFFLAALFYFLKAIKSGLPKFESKIFLLYFFPYLLWVFFAQNIEKARHVAPLIPILIIYFSYAIIKLLDGVMSSNRRYGYVIIAALVLSVSIDTGILLAKHKIEPPPAYSIMRYLSDSSTESDSILFCGETERFFKYYNPRYTVKRFKTSEEVIAELDGSLIEPDNIYITSMVNGVEALDVKEVVTFSRSRYIYNPFNRITVYKLHREGTNLLDF